MTHMRGHREPTGISSPPSMWAVSMELSSSGLVTNMSIYGAISPALYFNFCGAGNGTKGLSHDTQVLCLHLCLILCLVLPSLVTFRLLSVCMYMCVCVCVCGPHMEVRGQEENFQVSVLFVCHCVLRTGPRSSGWAVS